MHNDYRTGWVIRDRVPERARNFAHLQNEQTRSKARQVCLRCTGVSSPEIKRLQRTNDRPPPHSAEVQTECNCTPNCLYAMRREQRHSFYAHYKLRAVNTIKNIIVVMSLV